MSTVNDLITSYEEKKDTYDKYKPNPRIKTVLDFLNNNGFSRWHFAKANFGENFKWSKNDKSEDKYSAVQRQGYFTFQDIENMKGLNYGQYEFGANHYCVISTKVYRGIKLIHVIPMTSLKNKTPGKWDIVISPSEYQFLEHDTIIHVGRMQEIGIERFSIKEMKKDLLKNTHQPYELSGKDILKIKQILKNKFID